MYALPESEVEIYRTGGGEADFIHPSKLLELLVSSCDDGDYIENYDKPLSKKSNQNYDDNSN
jgi:hypothetical protein